MSRSRSRSKARTPRRESSSSTTRREGSALGLGRRTTRETIITTGRGGIGNISEEREKNSIELEKVLLLSISGGNGLNNRNCRSLPKISTKPMYSPGTPPTKLPTLTHMLPAKAAPATS